MYASTYLENGVLNTLRGTTFNAPATVYLALYLSNPGETGSGTEISYTGYQRRPITFTAPAPMSDGIGIQNTSNITFTVAPYDLGVISHIAVYSAQTGGNLLVYGELESPLSVEEGEAPVVAAGEARWWLTGSMSSLFATNVLNLLRGTSIPGVNPYLALYNGSPESSGMELSGTGYERLAITFSAPSEQSGGAAKIANSAQIESARAPVSWGTWSHSVIMDAATGGNALWAIARGTTKTFRSGLKLIIEPGNLALTLN